jgi:hypothetical protein
MKAKERNTCAQCVFQHREVEEFHDSADGNASLFKPGVLNFGQYLEPL